MIEPYILLNEDLTDLRYRVENLEEEVMALRGLLEARDRVEQVTPSK